MEACSSRLDFPLKLSKQSEAVYPENMTETEHTCNNTKHLITKNITAIILAGGLGTRLRTIVSDIPKPMAPVNGRPFLEYLFDYWITQGINHFVLSVGYKHEMIMDYFGNHYKGVTLDYVVEQIPLGTGGGFLLAVEKIGHNSPFLVLNGDTYFTINLQQLIQFAQKNDADWCFSLFSTENTDRYMGMDMLPEGQINSFKIEKQQKSCLVNGGVYWVHQQALLDNNLPLRDRISLENDIFPKLLASKQRLFGLEFIDKIFIDIGIPDDYHRSQLLLK